MMEELLLEYYLAHEGYKKAKKERKEIKLKRPQCLNYNPHTEDEPHCWDRREHITEEWCSNCKAIQPFYLKYIKAGKRLKAIKMRIYCKARTIYKSGQVI